MFKQNMKNKFFALFILLIFTHSIAFLQPEETQIAVEIDPKSEATDSEVKIQESLFLPLIALITASGKVTQNLITINYDSDTLTKECNSSVYGFFSNLFAKADEIGTSSSENQTKLLTEIAIFLNNAPISRKDIYGENFTNKITSYSSIKISTIISKRIINKLSHLIFPDQDEKITRRALRTVGNSLAAFLIALIVFKTIKVFNYPDDNSFSDAIKFGILTLADNIIFEALGEIFSSTIKTPEQDIQSAKAMVKKLNKEEIISEENVQIMAT